MLKVWLAILGPIAVLGYSITAFVLKTQAHELHSSVGIVCDTTEQVTRYVQLLDGNAQEAAELVNVEVQNPQACMILAVVYIKGDIKTHVTHKGKSLIVQEVVVLAVHTNGGLLRVQPTVQYALFADPDRGA